VSSRLSLPLASAEGFGLFPVVVGYGHSATWAYGLSALANDWRSYVLSHTQPDDLVLFFDAYDIIFQAGEEEIVDRYLEMEARSGHQLFYNADMKCTNPCEEEMPKSSSPWAYLNSGVYLGRARVIRDLYRDPMPDPLVDAAGRKMRLQYWHVLFYWAHRDRVTVDDQCELSQLVLNVDNLIVNGVHTESVDRPGGRGLVFGGGRLRNTITNTTPPILHFPGLGHWPDWSHPERPGTCSAWEVFRAIQPAVALAMEQESSDSEFIGLRPWRESCSHAITTFDRLGMRVALLAEVTLWIRYAHPEWAALAGFLVAVYAARTVQRLRQRTVIKAH